MVVGREKGGQSILSVELRGGILSHLLYFEMEPRVELVFLKSNSLEDSFSIFYDLMLIMEIFVRFSTNVSRNMYISDQLPILPLDKVYIINMNTLTSCLFILVIHW